MISLCTEWRACFLPASYHIDLVIITELVISLSQEFVDLNKGLFALATKFFI